MKQKEVIFMEPLAMRMRPVTVNDVVGQDHILGKGMMLRRAIETDRLGSLIFYGPPGTGKTSIASVIANTTKALFRQVNATEAGKAELRNMIVEAKYQEKCTVLFIDEIHRFNKAQQDYLLPFVENGTVTLIGATTENPFFEVNSALLSRSILFELKPFSTEDIKKLIQRAIEKGFPEKNIEMEEDAIIFLAENAGGDARAALNAIELSVLSTPSTEGTVKLTEAIVQECLQKKPLCYDKNGNEHYDTISAFIKSMRGSDPDATVYYLACMIEAGEDPKFIARRIMICAAEDVSNADPQALVLATAASQAVERIGMPEGRILLAQAALYVACAPKSNSSYRAIDLALEKVRKQKEFGEIPNYLRDAHYGDASVLGSGIGYEYPHDCLNHFSFQSYLPDSLKGKKFYYPSNSGYEKQLAAWQQFLRSKGN